MRSSDKKYWVLKCLILVAIVCIICPAAIADDSNDANKPPDSSWQGPSRSEERVPFEQRMQKKISVEFRNTPMEDVIRIMAQQADIDVIKSPTVTGAVTVTLTNVPLEEALNNILAAHGYSYVLSQNMIRVITAADKTEKAEPVQTRTFEIVYADVKEVVKALDKFKSKDGSVSSIQGTSYIIVTDTESKIRDIANLIEKIDRMTSQILIEARIYDIKNIESFKIEPEWNVGRNTPITKIGRTKTSGQTGTKTDSSTTTGSSTTTDNSTTTDATTEAGVTGPTTITTETKTVTNPPASTDKTVTVDTTTRGTAGITADTTITTATTGTTSGTGLTNTETSGGSITSSDNITETTAGTWLRDFYGKSNPYMGGGFEKTDGGTLRFGVLNDAVDIDLALSILHKQIGAKLLANPRILVLDNETASIKIISEIPYQQLTESAMGGTMGTTSWKEVGVELQVTPHVAIRDEMIRLHLKPKFSIRGEDVIVAGANVSYPEPSVDSREADTKLLVKNGQTVVLGGLRKRETTKDIRKVPLLGDLPVFGGLFRSESEDTTDSELVVFITVRIIKQPVVLSQGEQDAFKVTEFSGPKPAYTGTETREKGK